MLCVVGWKKKSRPTQRMHQHLHDAAHVELEMTAKLVACGTREHIIASPQRRCMLVHSGRQLDAAAVVSQR